MKPLPFFAIGVFMLSGTLNALDANQLDEFLKTLPATEGTSWRFAEIRSSDLFEQPVTAQGQLSIDDSGVLVKELTSPIGEKMILGFDEITVITPTKTYNAKLEGRPFLKGLAAGLRGLMARDAETILSYFEVDLINSDTTWTMILNPRETSLRRYIDKLEISGCKGHVSLVTTYTRRGGRQKMLFQDGFEACSP